MNNNLCTVMFTVINQCHVTFKYRLHFQFPNLQRTRKNKMIPDISTYIHIHTYVEYYYYPPLKLIYIYILFKIISQICNIILTHGSW